MYRATIFLILLACLSILILPTAAQDEPQSIFTEDTCAPPCWFGLIPGESRAEDVEQFLADYAIADVAAYGLFDEESQHLITGVYEFLFYEWEYNKVYVQIQVRDSLVYLIDVSVNSLYFDIVPTDTVIEESISLNETLASFGEPDHIYYYSGGNFFGHDNAYMTFIYLEPQLRVEFQNTFPTFYCSLQSIRDEIFVSNMTYFSPDAADVQSFYGEYDEQQPALTALQLGEAIVTQETWQEVMNGEMEGVCGQFPTQRDNPITAPLIYEEPDAPRSLFEGDTCAPPCWMGLTPGESTAEDVEEFIQTPNAIFREWRMHPDSIFDEQTGLMLSGTYSTRWLFHERDDAYIGLSDMDIYIADGIVSTIEFNPNRTILLRKVLEKLGTPDFVLINSNDVFPSDLEFVYLEPNVYIGFLSSRHCSVRRMSNNFWARRIVYGTSSTIQRPTYWEIPIPMETWQSWLNGDVQRSCRSEWQDVIEVGG